MGDSVEKSASRALCGAIPISLRAVTIEVDTLRNLYVWNSYFHVDPTEHELESQRIAATDLHVDVYQHPFEDFEENFVVKPYPEKIDLNNAILIYHRYEEGFIPPPVERKSKIGFGEINAVGLQSLNGLATEHLESVQIDFEEPYQKLTWFCLFSQIPSEEELNFQKQAIKRFLASFDSKIPFEMIQLPLDGKRLPNKKVIFARF